MSVWGRALWLYRGVRWRVISRWRKGKWAVRRFRRRLPGLARRVRATQQRVSAELASFQWTWSAGQVVRAVNPLHRGLSLTVHRQLLAAAEAELVRLAAGSCLEPTGPPRAARGALKRRARAVFQELPSAERATRQHVEVASPLRWNAQLRRTLGRTRFVTVAPSAWASQGPEVLRGLLPLFVSGRPVVHPDGAAGAWRGRDGVPIPMPTFGEACRMCEAELAHLALRQLRAAFGYSDDPSQASSAPRPRISVILATNRRRYLERAIAQIQAQAFVEIELIIGLHGTSADLEPADLERGAVTSAVVLEYDRDVVFGEVLQRLSALASTGYVSKWDDDDRYGRHHLLDLWLFAVLARAPLVGKAAEFVLLEELGLLLRRRGGRPFAPSTFLAGGTLLMSKAALMAIGNWGSLWRSVDQDLIQRFHRNRLMTLRIHGYEFVLIRHGHGHTWDADATYFLSAANDVRSPSALDTTGVLEPPPSMNEAVDDPRPAVPSSGPTPREVSVSICVPNRDNPMSVELFERRCSTLPGDVELVVCDDRSVPPLASSGNGARTTIVPAPPGHGFGAGRSRQRASEAARGDVLVFADADVHLSRHAFEALIEPFRRGFSGAVHARIGFTELEPATALAVVRTDGFDALEPLLPARELEGQVWREPHWARSADLAHPRSSSYRATVGALLVVDRETYRRAGGWRDVPVRGVEDIEFGYRLQAAGCEQLVYRGAGVWHLGQRTFQSGPDSEQDRHRDLHLSAWVPIWSRTLDERRETLAEWSDEIVPFVGLSTGGTASAAALNERFGPGTAIAGGCGSDRDSTPFCVATTPGEGDAWCQAVIEAHRLFRNEACGEVIVLDGTTEVARFVAVWAANLARRRLGATALEEHHPAELDAATLDRLRRDLGVAVVDLGQR